MVKNYKVDEVADLVSRLKNHGNVILTNYSGIKVKDISQLRAKLREKNAEYKVVKNTLFKRALSELGIKGLDDYLKGPIGVAFAGAEIGDVAKILKEFAKEQEKFSYSAGVVDEAVYNGEQIKTIADLPSKEALLAQIMSLVNGPAAKTAIGMNQIMASLARGINAVAKANNK